MSAPPSGRPSAASFSATTCSSPPPCRRPPFPPEIDGHKLDNPLDWISLCYPFNLTGQPAISVPCGWTEHGLPVGLQIVGRRFADVTVLRAAAAFEALAPWADRRPALA